MESWWISSTSRESREISPDMRVSEELNDKKGLLTDKQRETFDIVNFVVLCTMIGLFGITTNIINIIVFFKQGFTNTVNISFFSLAVSDLCCLVTLLWVGLCLNPLLANVGLPWNPSEFQYLTGAWPHIICGRITSYITAYVTVERCLCIIVPLKVKEIITPGRTALAVCLIYILNIFTLVPEYATSYFEWRFFPDTNRTLLTMAFTKSRQKVVGVVFFLSSVTGLTSFAVVVVFTAVLVLKLRHISKWRKDAVVGADNSGSLAGRDRKTMKMIVVISSILIVCYTPGTMITMATFLEPEFMLQRRYQNMCFAMWSVAFVFQAVNSSINIFLYYKMSTRYRETLDQMLGTCFRGRYVAGKYPHEMKRD